MAFHAPPAGHPERPQRLAAALRGARAASAPLPELESPMAERRALERVHPPAYLDAIDLACSRGGWLDADTYAHPPSREAYLRAAGGAVAAVEAVLRGELAARSASAGPRATTRSPSGRWASASSTTSPSRPARPRRPARAGWPSSTGTSTTATGRRTSSGATRTCSSSACSSGRSGRGAAARTRRARARGAGATRNLAFAEGTGPKEYLRRFEGEVLPALEAFAPELLIVSCGFDAHERDPLAGLRLQDETYGELTRGMVEVARRCSAPPPVVVLEGGYDLQAVEAGCREVVEALAG